MLNTSCGLGPEMALALVGQVGPDQRAEEHAVGAEEDPHAHLPVVEPGVADVRIVVRVRRRRGVACVIGHGGSR